MFNLKKIFAIASFLILLSGCSKQSPHLGESMTTTEVEKGVTLTEADSRRLLPSGKLAGEESALAQIESLVFKIDYTKRLITLKTAQGDNVDIIAGPEIRNFNQIQAGDKVKVEYLISVGFEVREPTKEEIAASKGETLEVAARAKLGEMPAAGTVSGRINIAKVESIDKTQGIITLRNINSQQIAQVKAKYPENLSYVKTGDSVVISAIEAVAASVTRVE